MEQLEQECEDGKEQELDWECRVTLVIHNTDEDNSDTQGEECCIHCIQNIEVEICRNHCIHCILHPHIRMECKMLQLQLQALLPPG